MGCINDEVHRDQRRKTGHMDERFHLEEGHLIWAQPLSVAARKSYSDKREREMTPGVQKPQVFYLQFSTFTSPKGGTAKDR
jgi:hypothetical protein